MGLFSNALKEIEKDRKDFRPLELTEENVEAIFNRCFVHPHDIKEGQETSASIPFCIEGGYDKDLEHIYSFDKKTLLKNKANILYLLGQLDAAYRKDSSYTLRDFSVNYRGQTVIQNKSTLMKFIYLTCAYDLNLFSPFLAKDNAAGVIPSIEPTLSPKDPKFPEWYEGYKARHPEIDFGE